MKTPLQYERIIKTQREKIEKLEAQLKQKKWQKRTKGPKWYLKDENELRTSHIAILQILSYHPEGLMKSDITKITEYEGATARLNEMTTHLGFIDKSTSVRIDGKTFVVYKITQDGLDFVAQREIA